MLQPNPCDNGTPSILHEDSVCPAPARGAGWMITLIDLISLLLCFFVLAFAGSSPPVSNWQSAGLAFRAALGEDEIPPPVLVPVAREPNRRMADVDYLTAVMVQGVGDDPALATLGTVDGAMAPAGIVVNDIDDRIVVALPQKWFFYPQSGQIMEGAATVFGAIVPHLSRLALPTIVAVEYDGSEPQQLLAFRRGASVRGAMDRFGLGQASAVYTVAAPQDHRRRNHPPCVTAAMVGQAGSVVVCLARGG